MSKKIKVKRLKNSPYAIQQGDSPIGKGVFATVRRAYNLNNPKQQLAVKIISIQDEDTAKTIKSELQMMKELPIHPNLVNCTKVQISSEKNFYIIMEYCNQGNLQKYIFDHKNDLSEEKIWFFLKQFCSGYRMFFDRKIIHRDLKPENILIHNGNFKISDFGLARIITDTEFNQNLSSKGTPLYMAPQLYNEKQGSSKVDVFSLGIIIYRLAFKGKFPFFQANRTYHSVNEYFKELMLKKLTFPQNHGRSEELVTLIKKMLIKNKDERIGWRQIFQMDRVKNALRNQRRKQILSMQQFRKSLIMVANASVTQVKVIQTPQANGKQIINQQKQQDTFITIQHAFSKKKKSGVQRKLYRNKLIYTLIDLCNRRMTKVLQTQNFHPYIVRQIEKLILTGMLFCLHLISRMQNISGDWYAIPTAQIMNFQDIFDNDREIIQEKIKAKGKHSDQLKYAEGEYDNLLYNFLTQYNDYPQQIGKKLNAIIGFLIEIYDLVIKINDEDKLQDEEKSGLLNYETEPVEKFQQFVYSLQVIKTSEIDKKMKKMGLIFI